MGHKSQLVNQVNMLYKSYQIAVENMDKALSLSELEVARAVLDKSYDALLKTLRCLRKEQKDDFDAISKEMIRPISAYKSVIHKNYERLDPTYDYEQGVLEENED